MSGIVRHCVGVRSLRHGVGSTDITAVGGGSGEERVRALVTRFGEGACSTFPKWLCTQTHQFVLSSSKIDFGYTT